MSKDQGDFIVMTAMSQKRVAPPSARWLPIVAACALLAASSAPALADCQEDMGKIMQERLGLIAQLNKMNSGGKGGKGQLDPIAACPKLRNLASAESRLVSYLEKNKDWCNVPDHFVESAKTGRDKSASFAAKACQVAAQIQKMKQQQAQGGGVGAQQAQKLPAGPL